MPLLGCLEENQISTSLFMLTNFLSESAVGFRGLFASNGNTVMGYGLDLGQAEFFQLVDGFRQFVDVSELAPQQAQQVGGHLVVLQQVLQMLSISLFAH